MLGLFEEIVLQVTSFYQPKHYGTMTIDPP